MGAIAKPRPRVSGKSKKKRSPWKRRILSALCILFIGLCIITAFFIFKFQQALAWAEPKVQDIDVKKALLAGSKPTTIVSADGKVLYRLQDEYRRYTEFKDIPDVVKEATLGAEDNRFYEHGGVNWISVGRAVLANASSGGKSQGASTITMQLVKRLYTSSEKSYDRKLKDMALAMQLEKKKTKDEILTMYLNQVFYGSGAYGIAAAADVYFNKKLSQLSIGEAAMLAGLVQRPSKDNPFESLDAAIRRRNYVLSQMRGENRITEAEYQTALSEKPKLARRSFGSGERILAAPYFVRYIQDQIDKLAPEIKEALSSGGYKVVTTLNSEIQTIAEKEVRRVVEKYRRLKVSTGAFVLIDSEGKVLAMVGGIDYERNQYNVAYQGRRQPGSSFKPFVYSAAFSTGVLGPNDYVSNVPLQIPNGHGGTKSWPKGGGSKYGDTVSVTTALAASLNPAAAHVCEMVTPQVAASYAKDVFGIRSPLDPVLSIVLGSEEVSPLEMAEAYSVFQLQGDRVEPFGITRIEGPNGELLHEFQPIVRRNLLDQEVAGWMDGILRKVVTSGTATAARVVPNARGKTGTTSDNRDAWFCGYTNNYVGIGWVGNEHKSGSRWIYDPMTGVFGGKVTVQIWVGVMKQVVDRFGDGEDKPVRQKALPPVDPVIEPLPTNPPVDDVAGGDETGPGTGNNATPPPTTGDTASPPTQGNPGTAPTDPKKPKPDSGTEEMVSVEICVESGQRSSIYCPETVTRKFKKGQAPKGKCPIHGPHQH